MSDSSRIFRIGALSFGAAVGASFAVLLLGMCAFGLHVAQWAEWQGRIVGLIATVAAVAGASVGLLIGLRAAGQKAK